MKLSNSEFTSAYIWIDKHTCLKSSMIFWSSSMERSDLLAWVSYKKLKNIHILQFNEDFDALYTYHNFDMNHFKWLCFVLKKKKNG